MYVADLHAVRAVTAIALGHTALALAAVGLTRLSDGIALMWPASGLLLGILGTVAPHRRPALIAACIAGSVAVTMLERHNAIAAVGFAVAGVGEGWLAFEAIRRLAGGRMRFDNVRAVGIFVVIAGFAAPIVSGVVGAATAHLAFGLPLFATWLDWWTGHGLGMVIVAPLVVLLALPELKQAWRHSDPRAAAMSAATLALVAAVTFGVFVQTSLPLLFLPAVPVLLATFQLGRVGAAAALVIVAAIGGLLTTLGLGPIMLVEGSAAFRFQFFHVFMGVQFMLALPTAAALARQRQLHRRLRESEAALRLLADHSTDMLVNLDVTGAIRLASPSVRALGGYAPEALIGRYAIELIEPAYRDAVAAAHYRALAAPETVVRVEYQARREDGTIGWFESNMQAVRGEDGTVASVISAIRDVGHRKSVEQTLRRAADTDPLTGLANRRPLVAALDAAIAAAGERAAALALFDVDHFKRVNDQYGHPAGDAALVMLADVCRRELRTDDLVARIGGEEFAVLLRGADGEVAQATCERLRLAIAGQPVLAAGVPPFRVTASCGLAPVTAGAQAEALLAAADEALYAAKAAGRNRLRIAA